MALPPNQATCQFCHKSFKNQQGVRAHLRHCAAYRQTRALGSLPRGAVPKANLPNTPPAGLQTPLPANNKPKNPGKAPQPPRLPTHTHQTQLATILTIAESIDLLLQECLGHTWYAGLTDSVPRPKDHAGVEEWRTLCQDLQRGQQLCHTMEQAWQVDRDALGTLYHVLQRIKSQWSTYRHESLMRFIQGLNMGEEEREQQWQQEYDRSELAQEEAQFATVIGQVRQLWVSV